MTIHFTAIPRRVYTFADMERAVLGRSIDIRDVIAETARASGITPADITGYSRMRRFVRPRQVVMFIAHRVLDRSLPEVGEALGGRDHTTVLHGVRAIEALMSPEMEQTIRSIVQEVEG